MEGGGGATLSTSRWWCDCDSLHAGLDRIKYTIVLVLALSLQPPQTISLSSCSQEFGEKIKLLFCFNSVSLLVVISNYRTEALGELDCN